MYNLVISANAFLTLTLMNSLKHSTCKNITDFVKTINLYTYNKM